MIVAPEYSELKKTKPGSFYARVEIDLKNGQTLQDVTEFPRGSNTGACRLSDDELKERFRICAEMIIPETKAQKALEIIMHLEDYDTLDTFIENITL